MRAAKTKIRPARGLEPEARADLSVELARVSG